MKDVLWLAAFWKLWCGVSLVLLIAGGMALSWLQSRGNRSIMRKDPDHVYRHGVKK